jgi:hypothetical protein
MINSIPALCRVLGASLRENVLPHLSDPYARGQLAAALYALANMESKATWSHELLASLADAREAALGEANTSILALGSSPPTFAPVDATRQEKRLEALDDAICVLFDWLEVQRSASENSTDFSLIERQLLRRVHDIAQQEKRLVPPSMMLELSGD